MNKKLQQQQIHQLNNLPMRKPTLSKKNKKKPPLRRNNQLQIACAAVAYATAKVKKIDHTHAVDVSQLNAVSLLLVFLL